MRSALTRVCTILIVLALLLGGLSLPVAAAGPVKYVDATFGNDANPGTMGAPFKTIQKGVDDVDALGTVYVAAGTYNESQVVLTKGVTVQGAGVDQSILDGGSAALINPGLLRINATTGNVTFKGFTLRHAGLAGASQWVIDVSGTTTGRTITISDNKIIGTNAGATGDFGIYMHGGDASVVFTRNTVTQIGGNSILIERYAGATEVSYNALDCGLMDDSADVYFSMTYGGQNITTLQKVHHNTFNMATGAAYDADHKASAVSFGASYGGSTGTYTNVEITDNHIAGLKGYRRGPGLWNDSPGDGSAGAITNAKITGNVMSGPGAVEAESKGIDLIGKHTGTIIQNNVTTGVDVAFYDRVWNTHLSSGTAFSGNSIVGCTQFKSEGAGAFNAENNWWGATTGPSLTWGGTVDYTPWSESVVELLPAQQTMYQGESKVVDIKITAQQLYGFQMILHYDSALYEVTAKNWVETWFHPDWKQWNLDTTTAGLVKIAATQQFDKTPLPVSGSGVVAQLTFKAKAEGVAHLTLTDLVLSEMEGDAIPTSYTAACLISLGLKPGSISGTVDLQGRSDDSGARIIVWPGGYATTTNAAGAYTIGAVPPGTYTVVADMERYLDGEKTGVVVLENANTPLPLVKLLGGDVNPIEDDKVDIGDLTIIGGVFNTSVGSTVKADINADSFVNIQDLVLAAGNYTKQSITDIPW